MNEDKLLEARIEIAVRQALAAMGALANHFPSAQVTLSAAPTPSDLVVWSSKALADAEAAHKMEVQRNLQTKHAHEAAAQEEARKAAEKSRLL